MPSLPACPQCQSDYVYQDQLLYVCPECGHEWSSVENELGEVATVITDAHGTPLSDGDDVTVIKDLKVKGSTSVIKQGTKVKGIRLIDAENGHDIDCKIPGFGNMQLKSEFVKKV